MWHHQVETTLTPSYSTWVAILRVFVLGSVAQKCVHVHVCARFTETGCPPHPNVVPAVGAGEEFRTARIGPRQGPDRAHTALEWPKITQSGSRVHGIHHLAIRPGAKGAGNTASWDPCDPPGLCVWPIWARWWGVNRGPNLGLG